MSLQTLLARKRLISPEAKGSLVVEAKGGLRVQGRKEGGGLILTLITVTMGAEVAIFSLVFKLTLLIPDGGSWMKWIQA